MFVNQIFCNPLDDAGSGTKERESKFIFEIGVNASKDKRRQEELCVNLLGHFLVLLHLLDRSPLK